LDQITGEKPVSDRAAIFGRIRAALEPIKERTPLPDFEAASVIAESRVADGAGWVDFQRNFEAVNGTFLRTIDDLIRCLRNEKATRGYFDPALPAHLRTRLQDEFELVSEIDRNAIDDIPFGISAAKAVIAETGTLILEDRLIADRLGALSPWAHVAVVPPSQVYPTVIGAVQDLGDDPNIIWVTGPSKTADVEGILIEGVHGPGLQAVLVGEEPVEPPQAARPVA